MMLAMQFIQINSIQIDKSFFLHMNKVDKVAVYTIASSFLKQDNLPESSPLSQDESCKRITDHACILRNLGPSL